MNLPRENGSAFVFHGSPKMIREFSVWRKSISEGYQLNFGIHFAFKPEDAAMYGNYIHRCRVDYRKLYDATQVVKLEDMHPEDREFMLSLVHASPSSRHLLAPLYTESGEMDFEQLVYTGIIERPSNRMTLRYLEQYGYDSVLYTAVHRHITGVNAGIPMGTRYEFPALIAIRPKTQVTLLDVVKMGGDEP